MGDRDTAAEVGRVFYVVDAKGDYISVTEFYGGFWWITDSREAVCSIPTTLVIIAKLSSGTFNQALNAAISCFLMSLPGWSKRYSNGPSTTFSFSADHVVP